MIVEHKQHCTMPQGTKVSTEVQWIIIQLLSSFKKDDISIFTGVSVQSVERILLYYKVHGTVHDLAGSEQRGKRRHLRDLDIEVSSSVTCRSFQFCHNHYSVSAWNCQGNTGLVSRRALGNAFHYVWCDCLTIDGMEDTV